ncbi:MAG: hypothetical protein HOF21_15210 [Nitrospina sp.]|nr:hypothetical protein [Nitrospina sp.]MBT7198072.1 hypothetical protein [Nitrospina sp.]
MRIIGIMLIGVFALLCSTNGWAETPTKKEKQWKVFDNYKDMLEAMTPEERKNERLKQQARKEQKRQEAVKLEAKRHEEILKEIAEKAPERCVCSDTAIAEIGGYLEKEIDILHCKCGKALCVVNLQGGVSCLKQGLLK